MELIGDNPKAGTGSAGLNHWDQRYLGDEYLFGTEPNAFLAAQRYLLKPGQKALAVADGEARNGVWLAQQGLDVLSIDFSAVAQEKARQLARVRGVTLQCELVDLATWTWQADQFDVIAAIFIQFAGPELREKIFRGIRDTLVPGGLVLLQGYRPEQLQYGTGGPPCAENMYTSELLRTAFASFEILQLKEHDSPTSEGRAHQGMSALIDLVARKPA